MLTAKIELIRRLLEQGQDLHEREEGQGGIYLGGGALVIIVLVILLILLL
jgi:hypothetical protein